MPLLEQIWKYTVLGATSILFEELNPVLGGIAARSGRAGLVGVIVAVSVGTWLASVGLYWVGKSHIDWVRRRFPKRQRLLDAALEIVERNPWRASLAVRFAYGLRIAVPIACGAARLPLWLYVIASGISCWVWSVVFVLLGWKAGDAALNLLRLTSRTDVRLAFVAIILIGVLVFMRRKRIAERTAHVLTGTDIPIMTAAERSARKR